VFIGASNSARVNPGAAKVMESMASMELYPQLTDKVYQDVNNDQWINYLEQIANEDQAQTVQERLQ
jgi:hypothetical protein